MKKTLMITLIAFTMITFTACENQERDGTTEQIETGTAADTNIEVDTAITQDPDTTTYHDMAL